MSKDEIGNITDKIDSISDADIGSVKDADLGSAGGDAGGEAGEELRIHTGGSGDISYTGDCRCGSRFDGYQFNGTLKCPDCKKDIADKTGGLQ